MGVAVSAAEAQWTLTMAMPASPKATLDCVNAFCGHRFSARDLGTIHVPALVIHGDNDQTVPLASSGERTAQMLPHAQHLVYAGRAARVAPPKQRPAQPGFARVCLGSSAGGRGAGLRSRRWDEGVAAAIGQAARSKWFYGIAPPCLERRSIG